MLDLDFLKQKAGEQLGLQSAGDRGSHSSTQRRAGGTVCRSRVWTRQAQSGCGVLALAAASVKPPDPFLQGR